MDESLTPLTNALVVRATEGELISTVGVDHLFKLTGQHTPTVSA